MVPMEATVMPLPTELTTPPVTKIYIDIQEDPVPYTRKTSKPYLKTVRTDLMKQFCAKPYLKGIETGFLYYKQATIWLSSISR